MADGTHPVESVARRYLVLRPHLDERQRRLFLGAEAREFGTGGIKVVAAATGVHPDTIARGVRELAGEAEPAVRVRAPGVAADLDDEVDAEPGRCVDRARASGQ